MTGPNFQSSGGETDGERLAELSQSVSELVERLAVESLPQHDDVSRRGIYKVPDVGGPLHHPFLVVEVWPTHGETPQEYSEYRTVSLYDDEDTIDNSLHSPAARIYSENGSIHMDMYGEELDDRPALTARLATRLLRWLEDTEKAELIEPRPSTQAALDKLQLVDSYLPMIAKEKLDEWGSDGFLILDTYDQYHRFLTITSDGNELNLISDWRTLQEPALARPMTVRRRQSVQFADDDVSMYFLDVLEEGIMVDGKLVATNPGDAEGFADSETQHAFLAQLATLLELAKEHDIVPASRANV